MIVDSLDNENLLLSARNLRNTKVVNSFGLNIYDLLYHDHLVLSRDAATEIETLLGANKGSAATEATDETPDTPESNTDQEAA